MPRLKEFRLFVAAFEETSFSAAGRRENTTQSGVSQHIQRLEDVLGVRLFHRRGKRIAPTPAGETYYRHCAEMLSLHDEAMRDMQRFRGAEGELKIGLTPWMSRHILPAALDAFVTEFPNVSVRIVEDENHSLAERAKRGEFPFVIMPETDHAEHATVLLESRALLASCQSRSALRGDEVTSDQLSKLKLILPSSWSRWRKVVERYLDENNCVPLQTMEITSLSAAVKFIVNTDWHSILPGIILAAEPECGLIATRQLRGAPIFRIISASSQGELPAPAEAFRALLAREITTLGAREFPVPSTGWLRPQGRPAEPAPRKPITAAARRRSS
ncbi:LysR family transcriptional regulator [Bosea thiooxidans]|nr:LysR family transcriptional regulator [Bosea sp. (in: a-proteobacteria)]